MSEIWNGEDWSRPDYTGFTWADYSWIPSAVSRLEAGEFYLAHRFGPVNGEDCVECTGIPDNKPEHWVALWDHDDNDRASQHQRGDVNDSTP